MTYERTDSHYTDFRNMDRLVRLRRMRGLARLMDTALRIPGTRFSLGADSVMGLIPGIGDFAGAAISLYIVNEARRLGVPNDKLVKMLVNIGFDAAAGSVPLVGDLFDVYFKSNRRNLELVLDHFGLDHSDLDRKRPKGKRAGPFGWYAQLISVTPIKFFEGRLNLIDGNRLRCSRHMAERRLGADGVEVRSP